MENYQTQSTIEDSLAQEAQAQTSPEADVRRLEVELGLVDPDTGTDLVGPEEEQERKDLEVAQLEEYFGMADEAKKQEQPEEEESLSEGVKKEVKKSFKESTAMQLAAGVAEGGQELINLGLDFANWAESNLGLDVVPDDAQVNVVNKIVPDSSDPKIQISRKVMQFLGPFGVMSKVLKVGKAATTMSKIGRASSAGFVADLVAQAPDEDHISDLMQEVPMLSPLVIPYLTTDEDDSRFESRMKNGLEGILLGNMVEGLVGSIKLFKKVKGFKATKKTADEVAAGKSLPEAKPEPPPAPKAEPPPAREPEREFIEVDPEKIAKKNADKTKAVNINLEKYPDDLSSAIKNFADNNKEFIESSRGKMTPEDEVQALADELGMTVDTLLAKRGQAYTAEEITATRILLASQADDLAQKAAKAIGGSDADKAAFLESQQLFAAISETLAGATAQAGRALRSFKSQVTKNEKFREQMLRQYVDAFGGDIGVDRMARQIDKIAKMNPDDYVKSAGKIVRKSKFAKLNEAVYETFIGNLLAAPTTQIINLTSNTIQQGIAFGESGIMSIFGQQVKGSTRAMGRGMIDGTREVINNWAGRVLDIIGLQNKFQNDIITDISAGASKIENHYAPAMTSEAFGLKSLMNTAEENADRIPFTSLLGTVVDGIGKFGRFSLNILQHTDDAFRTIAARGKYHQMAHQDAVRRGLTGDDYVKHIDQFMRNPPDDVRMLADDFSKEHTFTKPLEGRFKQINDFTQIGSGSRFFGNVGPLKYFVPFSRTNLNLVKQSIERTPFALLLDDVHATLKAGGPDAFMAKARIAYGTTFLAGVGTLAYQGLLTGGAPKDSRKRKMWYAAGNQPYSFKFGDKNIQYREMGGLGLAIKAATDIGQIMSYTTIDDRDITDGLAEAGVTLIGHLFTPEFLMSGIGQLTDMTSGGPQSDYARERFISNLLLNATPIAGSRSLETIRKFKDPLRRDNINLEEQFSYWDKYVADVKNRIPGLSDTLPPQRNIWGEPIEYAGGFVAGHVDPFYMSEEDSSPIMKEIIRMGGAGLANVENFTNEDKHLTIGMPSKKITKQGVSVKLSGEEYSRLVQLAGGDELDPRINPYGNQNLKQTLNNFVQSEDYKYMIDKDRIKEIGLIISRYRRAAKEQLIIEMSSISDEFQQRQLDIQNRRQEAIETQLNRGGADVGF